MRKVIRKLAMCNCLLLAWTSLAFAAENPPDSSDVTTLDEVVVRSTALSDYLVTTEVITAEKIKEMGATNLAEAIKRVPGLYVAYAGKGARLVRIRGAESDQTKIYIDGMPVFPLSGIASNSASTLEQISVDNIEKIEIIKGPGPVQYGTDYKGGVILITTKKGQGPAKTSFNLSAGSHEALSSYLTHSGSEKDLSYYLTVGRKQGDGHLNNSNYDTKEFNGKFVWDLGKDSALTLSGYSINTPREIPNGIDPITGEETASNISWSYDTPIDGKYRAIDWKYTYFKETNVALQYDKRASDKFKYNVKWYHVTDGNSLWVYNQNNATLGIDNDAHPIWYGSSWNSSGNGVEFTGDLQTAANNTVTFGMKYNGIDWKMDERNTDLDEHGKDKRIGYYISDNWIASDKTNVTLGVRYDEAEQSYHYSLTGKPTQDSSSDLDSTDPVFNITHRLDEQNTLRFSAGKSHVFVQAKSASTNLTAGLPVPDPERATDYELGWKHNFNEQSSLDIAVFKNLIKDRIVRRGNSEPNPRTYYNIGQTDIKGLELQYNRTFTNRLSGFVNYTHLKAMDTNADGSVTRATKLPISEFNYGLTYSVDKLQASILGHVLSDVLTNETINPRLDSYHLVDLSFNYRVNENTDYYLRVNNVFDTNYWETASYPGDGISFSAGVNLKL